MTTAGELVDRLYRDYLYAGDDQPSRTTLSAAVDADDTTWTYSRSMFAADEESVLSPGVLVEIGLEQALVTARSGGTLTVRRGVNGTTATAHDSGDVMTVAPTFTRQTVLDAVGDNVVDLYPALWCTNTVHLTVAHPYVEAPDDMESIVSARWLSASGGDNSRWYNVPSVTLLRNVEQLPSGRAVVVDANAGTELWLVYRGSFSRPTRLIDNLTKDFGVEPAWERIVVVGAAAQLLFGSPDMDMVTPKFLTEQFEAETFPASTAGQMAARLTQYRGMLLDQAARSLRSREQTRVSYTGAGGRV